MDTQLCPICNEPGRLQKVKKLRDTRWQKNRVKWKTIHEGKEPCEYETLEAELTDWTS